MPFHIGSARAGFTRVCGLGEDLGVDVTYKYMGHRENNKDVMQRHEAYVEDIHVEAITKYGKAYWNTIDSELEYVERIKYFGYTDTEETLRDILLRADRCFRDYGYAIK
ncbi:hypothetical protein [Bacillus cereus]|uniref:Uncharacterized protein n=1 Tax=Bacillus cereus MC67 TaxID=1053219 RepID=J8BGB5_BACCE|nr:hypothetical protein [Bacillus cereus]EJQ92953.1 hypothetical protein II3_05407 [Bacillus cereus MC67]EOP02172.1 hypothetical protein II1_04771 [Bacillus cereus MC118]